MMKRLFGIVVVAGLTGMSAFAEKAGPADANSDGKVSKQEFVDMLSQKASKAGKEVNKAAFEKQFKAKDKNGDGFLTKDELAPAKPKPQAESSEE